MIVNLASGFMLLVAAYALAMACLLATLTPCATEGSTWCQWNAHTMGNGQGHSFIALWGETTISLGK